MVKSYLGLAEREKMNPGRKKLQTDKRKAAWEAAILS